MLLANNSVGLEVCKYLKERNENIVALAVHEKEKQFFTENIILVSKVPEKNIFFASELRTPYGITKIKKINPDIIIAAFWGYILKKELLQIPKKGAINFHPGYLPYNRGMNPNVWPLIENTPAGVSIHYIDEGIDSGDIIARKRVQILPTDTAGDIYDRTLLEIVTLFKGIWPGIKDGTAKRIPQKKMKEIPIFHLLKDVDKLDKVDLEKKYTGKELIDLLRARSYKNRFFSYFMVKGKKIFVRIELSEKSYRKA